MLFQFVDLLLDLSLAYTIIIYQIKLLSRRETAATKLDSWHDHNWRDTVYLSLFISPKLKYLQILPEITLFISEHISPFYIYVLCHIYLL